MGAACVSFGLTGALTGSIHLNWTSQGWFWVATMTLLCTVVAITSFLVGVSRIGPSRASLSPTEPGTSIVAATALFGNAFSATQWLGGVLILVATAITAIYGNVESRVSSHKKQD
jgi:drug/metabolite transporter (DMT)-like permease